MTVRDAQESPRWGLVAGLVAVTILSRLAFLYRHGMPDPDSVMVAAGVALGATGSMPFADTFLYGRQLNPGVFLVMRALWPWGWNDPASLMVILNLASAVCGSLTLFPLHDLLRRLLPVRASLSVLAVWAFTPLVWETQLSFHPMVPATLFELLALACATRVTRGARGALHLALATLCAVLGFLFRVEVAFLVPAILLAILLSRKRARAFLVAGCIGVAVAAVYAIVLNATAPAHTPATSGVHSYTDRFREMYGMGASLRGIPRSAVWACLGLGIASIAAALVAFVMRRDARARCKALLIGLCVAVPVVAFWLPYLVPILRHYYLASLGVVLVLGATVMVRATTPRRLVAITVVVIAVNLLVPEVLYRAHHALTGAEKWPHGSFFAAHARASQRVDELADTRANVVTCRSGDHPRAIVLGRWDVYANVVYETASHANQSAIRESRVVAPETRYVQLLGAGADVRIIHYLYLDDPAVQRVVTDLLLDAQREGCCVFLPADVDFPGLPDPAHRYR